MQGLSYDLYWARERIKELEIALHTIVGHGNITVERAKQVAREALGENA